MVTARPPVLPAGVAEVAAAAEEAAEGLARGLEVVVAATTDDAADVVVAGVSVAPDKVFVWIVKDWLDELSALDEKGPVPQYCAKESTRLGGQLDCTQDLRGSLLQRHSTSEASAHTPVPTTWLMQV